MIIHGGEFSGSQAWDNTSLMGSAILSRSLQRAYDHSYFYCENIERPMTQNIILIWQEIHSQSDLSVLAVICDEEQAVWFVMWYHNSLHG